MESDSFWHDEIHYKNDKASPYFSFKQIFQNPAIAPNSD
jgi:hypothetical protein